MFFQCDILMDWGWNVTKSALLTCLGKLRTEQFYAGYQQLLRSQYLVHGLYIDPIKFMQLHPH